MESPWNPPFHGHGIPHSMDPSEARPTPKNYHSYPNFSNFSSPNQSKRNIRVSSEKYTMKFHSYRFIQSNDWAKHNINAILIFKLVKTWHGHLL